MLLRRGTESDGSAALLNRGHIVRLFASGSTEYGLGFRADLSATLRQTSALLRRRNNTGEEHVHQQQKDNGAE